MPDYDLVVIGSGPAGERGATEAAYFGKKVALVEKAGVLGGATANTGTLPSKTLRETALYLSGFRQRGLFGVDLSLKERVTIKELMFRERKVKENERARVAWNLGQHGVRLVGGTASLADPHTVAVRKADGSTEQLSADVILVATGSSPNRPPLYAFEDDRIHDSDELLDMHEVPETLAVIGGGVIGCEYACTFAALGIPVTLLEQREKIIPFLDGEIGGLLRERMEALGVQFAMPDSVKACDSSGKTIKLSLQSGKVLEVSAVLVAAGRTGNTAGLNLDTHGIKLDPRGRVLVDATYCTSVPHIYAAGDVIGFPALASTSMEQGRIAVAHAFGFADEAALASILPYGVYTIPEVSMAGETEESLKEKKIDYVVGRAHLSRNPRGEIIGETYGVLKLLFQRDNMKLLGVHVLGEQASELVHVGLTALLTNEGAGLFLRTCFNYPTLSEGYKHATFAAIAAKDGKHV